MSTAVKSSRIFPDKVLTASRLSGDATADALIAAIASAQGRGGVAELMRWLGNTKDLSLEQQPQLVAEFMQQHSVLPPWANRQQMERGMRFFERHAAAIGLTLGCYSLPYCYAGADGARVLWLSQRIYNDTQKRLEETGEWLSAVTKRRNWDSNVAIIYTLKVRLLHAAVRWFTLHSGQWDMAWGYPINQEDMAGTNGAFSYIVIRGLRKSGISTTEEEEEAYLHHLNVVGYFMGVQENLLPQNLREAFHLDRAIARRNFQASEQGQALTKSLLTTIENLSPPALRNLPAAQMRFFLGDALADLLGIPAVPLEKRLVGLANSLPFFSKLLTV